MVLKADYEFLFVGKDDNSFLENYSYDMKEEHGERGGEIFINLEIQNNPVDSEEIGSTIFESMQSVFFEDVDKEPYVRFEAALKAVNGILARFKAEKVSGYIGNLNVIIAAIVGGDLFLTQCGDAEAYLIRKRFVSIVSEGLNEGVEGSIDTFSSIASGKIEAGDTVIFSSTRLVRYISKTDLAQSVHRGNIVESLGEIKDMISTEILGRVGLTGVLFSEAKDESVGLEGETESSTMSMLEDDHGKITARKESLMGRFLSKFKGVRRQKAQVFNGGSEFSLRLREGLSDFSDRFFSKKFGKDKILVLLILVIAVLTVGIFYANSSQGKQAELERLDGILTSVHDKVAEAETKGLYDKEKAKEILDKAYLDAKSVFDSEFYRDKASLYLIQIEEVRDKLDNVKRIENPKVFADLTTKRADVNALGFALFGDRVFVYEYNALYEIVLDQVQDPLTIDDKETVVAATGFADRNSVVFLTKTGKIIEYKDGTMSFMDTEEVAFHKGVAIADWSNRIYILDSAGNQIWRYTYKGSQAKFGVGEGYVVDGTDLAASKDFAIDSNVYVLESNADIFKFYGGKKAQFYVNNAPFNMTKDPAKIYTSDKLDSIYVVDAKGGRVLVFQKDTKTGNVIYTTQYLFDGVGELRDLYVSPDSKKMYVLTKNSILEVDL